MELVPSAGNQRTHYYYVLGLYTWGRPQGACAFLPPPLIVFRPKPRPLAEAQRYFVSSPSFLQYVKLCFVINVLNNKRIALLNLAVYPLICAHYCLYTKTVCFHFVGTNRSTWRRWPQGITRGEGLSC